MVKCAVCSSVLPVKKIAPVVGGALFKISPRLRVRVSVISVRISHRGLFLDMAFRGSVLSYVKLL